MDKSVIIKLMNWLKENWFKIGLLTTFVVAVIGIFWFQYVRPTQIRRACLKITENPEYSGFGFDEAAFNRIMKEKGLGIPFDEVIYKKCLAERGL